MNGTDITNEMANGTNGNKIVANSDVKTKATIVPALIVSSDTAIAPP